MRICVVGAGAIGGWIAAKLAISGRQVMALSSRGPVNELELSERGRTDQVRLARFDGAADLLILAVKAPSLARAAQAAQAMIGPATLLLPAVNGVPWWFTPGEPLLSVDPAGEIDAAIPFGQVIGCVVHASSSRAACNRVVVAHSDKLILGEPNGGTSDRIAAVSRLLEEAGIRVEQSENIRRAIWYKLWGNATINPLSALTRATADRLLDEPELRQFMLGTMSELAAIGEAVSCPIQESGEDRMAVTARLGAFKTSMLQDVEARRPIELEALVGAPLEIAARHGLEVPRMRLLYAMTQELARSLRL